MTSEEAILAAGLDWVVEKQEVFIQEKTERPEGEVNVRLVQVPDHFAIVRVTDRSPLGVVGGRYTPLQNKDAFKFFDELVGSKEAIFETAGSLRGGRIIWIMSKLPGVIGSGDDPIEQWLVLSNAHDGSRKVSVMATPVRVVCMNTLNAAITAASSNYEMTHTSGIFERIVDAREALGLVTQYFERMGDVLNMMKTRTMTDAERKSYVYALFPMKVKSEASLEGFEDTLNAEIGPRIKVYVEKMFELLETGKGTDLPGVKGTLYGAFNAACEFADHWKPVKGNNDPLNRKLDSIWFGTAARFKQDAFDYAVGMMKDSTDSPTQEQ
jgi:phage/plasmid-like protein (TIGR03299 family)